MRPSDFNLPSTFTDFYPGQFDAIMKVAASEKRFVLFSGPPGSGKTLMMIAVAILNGGRVLICTVKKSLQDQYLQDFASIGLVEVRGQANYRCLALDPGGELSHLRPMGAIGYMGCDKGPCRTGELCQLRASGCPKFDAIRTANDASLIVTNYAYRISMARHRPDVLGKFDLLILDEAHCIPGWVEKFNTAVFTEKDLQELSNVGLPVIGRPWLDGKKKRGPTKVERKEYQDAWIGCFKQLQPRVRQRLADLKSHDEKDHTLIGRLKNLDNSLSIVQTPGIDWSIESRPKEVIVTPKWVGPLCEANLYCGVPKVILTSGTLSEDVAKYTGIKKGEYDYFEMTSRFSARRRPIYYTEFNKFGKAPDVNRKVFMKYPFPEQEELLQIERMDEIIEARQDRKGLILPVTYERTKIILRYSKWADSNVLFGHKKGASNVRTALERFRSSRAPSCLVSPPSGEGIDLKGDQCRYIIIPKVPMVPTKSTVMEERCNQDSGYRNYLTALSIVQYVARGMRGPKDWCEVIILDAQWEWFINSAQFANWFLKACFTTTGLPKAMEEPR